MIVPNSVFSYSIQCRTRGHRTGGGRKLRGEIPFLLETTPLDRCPVGSATTTGMVVYDYTGGSVCGLASD
jgi:hypothetical protein